MEDYKAKLTEAFRQSSIIGYSTSFSVIIYGMISYFILSRSSNNTPVFDNIEIFKQVAWMICFSIAIAVSLFKRVMIKRMREARPDVDGAIKQLQSGAVVSFAMCESIALVGFILSLFSKNINDYYGLAFFSLMSFAFYFPKYHIWDRHLKMAVYSFDTIDK